MVLLTSFRDSADNAPAPTNWSTPSYCANLQAPRDTWVQLCTASLVEPTHHVSVCPPAAFSRLLKVPSYPNFLSSICFLPLPLPLFIPFFVPLFLSDLNKLRCLSFLSAVSLRGLRLS